MILMARIKATGSFNWLREEERIMECTCSCGGCGTDRLPLEEGDTVYIDHSRGIPIRMFGGTTIRVKEFTIHKFPKQPVVPKDNWIDNGF